MTFSPIINSDFSMPAPVSLNVTTDVGSDRVGKFCCACHGKNYDSLIGVGDPGGYMYSWTGVDDFDKDTLPLYNQDPNDAAKHYLPIPMSECVTSEFTTEDTYFTTPDIVHCGGSSIPTFGDPNSRILCDYPEDEGTFDYNDDYCLPTSDVSTDPGWTDCKAAADQLGVDFGIPKSSPDYDNATNWEKQGFTLDPKAPMGCFLSGDDGRVWLNQQKNGVQIGTEDCSGTSYCKYDGRDICDGTTGCTCVASDQCENCVANNCPDAPSDYCDNPSKYTVCEQTCPNGVDDCTGYCENASVFTTCTVDNQNSNCAYVNVDNNCSHAIQSEQDCRNAAVAGVGEQFMETVSEITSPPYCFLVNNTVYYNDAINGNTTPNDAEKQQICYSSCVGTTGHASCEWEGNDHQCVCKHNYTIDDCGSGRVYYSAFDQTSYSSCKNMESWFCNMVLSSDTFCGGTFKQSHNPDQPCVEPERISNVPYEEGMCECSGTPGNSETCGEIADGCTWVRGSNDLIGKKVHVNIHNNTVDTNMSGTADCNLYCSSDHNDSPTWDGYEYCKYGSQRTTQNCGGDAATNCPGYCDFDKSKSCTVEDQNSKCAYVNDDNNCSHAIQSEQDCIDAAGAGVGEQFMETVHEKTSPPYCFLVNNTVYYNDTIDGNTTPNDAEKQQICYSQCIVSSDTATCDYSLSQAAVGDSCNCDADGENCAGSYQVMCGVDGHDLGKMNLQPGGDSDGYNELMLSVRVNNEDGTPYLFDVNMEAGGGGGVETSCLSSDDCGVQMCYCPVSTKCDSGTCKVHTDDGGVPTSCTSNDVCNKYDTCDTDPQDGGDVCSISKQSCVTNDDCTGDTCEYVDDCTSNSDCSEDSSCNVFLGGYRCTGGSNKGLFCIPTPGVALDCPCDPATEQCEPEWDNKYYSKCECNVSTGGNGTCANYPTQVASTCVNEICNDYVKCISSIDQENRAVTSQDGRDACKACSNQSTGCNKIQALKCEWSLYEPIDDELLVLALLLGLCYVGGCAVAVSGMEKLAVIVAGDKGVDPVGPVIPPSVID